MPQPSTAPRALSRYISDCPRYRYEELRIATKNFHEGLLLGVGGFGKVYRGVTADGQHIAVKALTPNGLQVRDSALSHTLYRPHIAPQGDREFYVEACMLARLQHPNLVRLLGVCDEGEHRMCVTEYMHRGSLRTRLDDTTMPLSWHERLQAALDTARGLSYLHEHCTPPVVHRYVVSSIPLLSSEVLVSCAPVIHHLVDNDRDFKSANVLIDAFGAARVADFGLAKTLAGVSPHCVNI